MRPKNILFLTLAVLAALTTTYGQANQNQSSNEVQPKAPKAFEKEALALLKEAIVDAESLRNPENAIRIQVLAADLLWEYDQDAARTIFLNATTKILDLLDGIDPADQRFHERLHGPLQLRQQVAQTIGKRDPQQAIAFLRASRPAVVQLSPNYMPRENEIQIELGIASQLAEKNSELALKIAEENLVHGFSHGYPELVSRLMQSDRAAATRLASAILNRLGSENLLTNQHAANVAAGLLQFSPESNDRNPRHGERFPPLFSVQQYSELLEMVLRAVLTTPPGLGQFSGYGHHIVNNLLTNVQSMMPAITKYAPASLPALQRRIAQSQQALDPRNRFWAEHRNVFEGNTSLEQILALAEQAPVEMRPEVYDRAIWKAFHEGDIIRARQLVDEYITNPVERARRLSEFERQLAWKAANEGRFEEARLSIARIASIEERIALLIQLSSIANGKGERRLAEQLLEEAYSIFPWAPESSSHFQAQIQLARAFLPLNAIRSFELIEAIWRRLDTLLEAAEILNGFELQYFSNGELSPNTTLGSLIYNQAAELSLFANADFARAKAIADRFQRPEVRVQARLSVARGILSAQSGAGSTNFRGNVVFSRRLGG